ncbi:MAG: TnsA endonuclease N-terminal domain-containing protein [Nibricoccus sp.]
MRGRYRPYYLARDFEKEVTAKEKCQMDGPGAYLPLFRIIDFPSIGFRTAMRCWITQRPVELMSSVEEDAFLLFHTYLEVVQIFEQVALDPTETRQIAKDLKVEHPAVKEGEIIMSSDFVVTVATSAVPHRRAFAVKREVDLSQRVIEKLAIEREYWRRRNIDWTLLLDSELPRIEVENMRLVYDWHDPSRLPCNNHTIELIRAWLTPHVETENRALRTLAQRCDDALHLETGTSLGVAYHLMVRRIWPVDFSHPFHSIPKLTSKVLTP